MELLHHCSAPVGRKVGTGGVFGRVEVRGLWHFSLRHIMKCKCCVSLLSWVVESLELLSFYAVLGIP